MKSTLFFHAWSPRRPQEDPQGPKYGPNGAMLRGGEGNPGRLATRCRRRTACRGPAGSNTRSKTSRGLQETRHDKII
eukprot:5333441-Pyramimonas_sp.AAC.1